MPASLASQLPSQMTCFLEVSSWRAAESRILRRIIGEQDIETYYTDNSQRDYWLLELFLGHDMHTLVTLKAPALLHSGNTVKMLFVLMEISLTRAAHILEVGFCHYFCTLLLAALLPNVCFDGIDITKRHYYLANRQKLPNTNFTHGDASVDLQHMGMTFDVIIAVEALCCLDAPAKMKRFMSQAARCLSPRETHNNRRLSQRNSRMAVCFLTRATCKNVRQNLTPQATAYRSGPWAGASRMSFCSSHSLCAGSNSVTSNPRTICSRLRS